MYCYSCEGLQKCPVWPTKVDIGQRLEGSSRLVWLESTDREVLISGGRRHLKMCLCKAGDGFNILQGACLTAIHPIDGQRNSKGNDPVVPRFLMSVKFYQWRAIQANAHLDPRQYSALSVPREIGEHHERLPRLHSDQPTEKTCYRRSGFERQVNLRRRRKPPNPQNVLQVGCHRFLPGLSGVSPKANSNRIHGSRSPIVSQGFGIISPRESQHPYEEALGQVDESVAKRYVTKASELSQVRVVVF